MTRYVYVFVDTNLFLQCRDVKDLPWENLFPNDDLRIMISRPVQVEIDKLKSDGNARRAKRARRANSYFREILFSDNEVLTVRERPRKIEVMFTKRSSTLKAVERRLGASLDTTMADDAILAELVDFSENNPHLDVRLLTHDTNPLLTAKRLGKRYEMVPDDWLLDPEPDGRDKRIKKLEGQLLGLTNSSPAIKIECIPNNCPVVIKRFVYVDLNEEKIERLASEIESWCPMQLDFEDHRGSTDDLSGAIGRTLSSMYEYLPPSQNDKDKYTQDEYPSWQKKIREALRALPRYLHQKNDIEFKIKIENTGNVPADHVRFEFSLSEGLFLCLPDSDRDDTSIWRLPKPPDPPKGRHELILGRGLRNFPIVAQFQNLHA